MDGQTFRRYGVIGLILWTVFFLVISLVWYARAELEYQEASALVEAKKAELERIEERERAITRQRQVLQQRQQQPASTQRRPAQR